MLFKYLSKGVKTDHVEKQMHEIGMKECSCNKAEIFLPALDHIGPEQIFIFQRIIL